MTATWGALALAAVLPLSAYFAFAGYLFFSQGRKIYRPDTALTATPARFNLRFEDVHFMSAGGIRLHGWYVPCDSRRGVVLFCHGNTGNIAYRMEMLDILHRLHYDVFVFDYRGYGNSEGVPSEHGTYEDARAAWTYLLEQRGIEPGQIVVWGRSLGGAIASWLAANVKAHTLIVESTFRSMADLAADLYPFLPVKWIARLHYPTQKWLEGVSCPTLVVHSVDDELIPFGHAQSLFDSIGHLDKQLLRIRGRHDDGFVHARITYEAGVRKFLLRERAGSTRLSIVATEQAEHTLRP